MQVGKMILQHQPGIATFKSSEVAKTSEFTPRAKLERLIRAAGRVPVERDTAYNRVDRSKMPPMAAPPQTDLVSLTLNV